MGFDDHWVLPLLEEEKKMAIICQTQDDRKIYNRAKKMIRNYGEKETEKIIELFHEFYELTEMDKKKMAILIGIALSAPFREPIRKRCGFYPALFLAGKQNTGKTYMEDFWIVHFYGLHKEHYSPALLESPSQLEDLLSSSAFPVNIQEVHKCKSNIIALIKDSLSSKTSMRKKKSATEYLVDKPKIAPLVMDANEVPIEFNDIPSTTKMIRLHFEKEIKGNTRWGKLYNILIKKKLFSLVYDYTKDWDNEILESIFNGLETRFDENYKDYTRIKQIWIAVMFGLVIFTKVFHYDFEKLIKESGSDILELLASERRKTFEDFGFLFHGFCLEAINYDEGHVDDRGFFHRGNNKPQITSKLLRQTQSKDGEDCFIFTELNKIDFQKYNEERLSLPKIYGKLEEGLKDKSLLIYGTHNIGGTNVKGIKIRNDWWNLYKSK
jgi:hypothetical protein